MVGPVRVSRGLARPAGAVWPGPAAPRIRPRSQFAWQALALCLAVAGLYALLASWHTLDSDHWFVPWLDQMVDKGAWRSLGQPMQVETEGASGYANYNPPYLYLLALGSLLAPHLAALAVVKLVAVVGTVFCAACVYGLLRRFAAVGNAMLAAIAFLLLPTVALNGAGWGQTDAIYSGLLALTVAAAVAGRLRLMMAAFGAAFAFKLPAAFLGPFVLYVVISRRVPFATWLLAPFAYGLSLVPAWLAGRSLGDLAGVYLEQADTYHWLSMKAPNPWVFVQHLELMGYGQGVLVGTACALMAGLLITGLAFRWRLEGSDLLLLAAVSAMLVPFLLPKMHDRYFFPADVLSFAYAVARPGWRPVVMAAAVQFGSLAAYASILFDIHAGPSLGAVSMSGAILLAGVLLTEALARSGDERPRGPGGLMGRPPLQRPLQRQG